ncbi:tyrosine-type recombinase/integrase [Candidatus Clavichlamydia salmonicola]|uniref:tyrosine-type recombinase/integrase n=1 Tax=Candidatus Clavichlamydia salmonicola TaxID=469812 RepID=UPI0018917E62|nr:site-specific integrase [Candidatus Clavichlamydia salmonicola]
MVLVDITAKSNEIQKTDFMTFSLKTIVTIFLSQIENQSTKKRYETCFKAMFENHVLEDQKKVYEFYNANLNFLMDSIFRKINQSRSSQQTCAAAFISFFKFLNRVTNGRTPIPIPQRQGIFKTFKKIREKTSFDAIQVEVIPNLIVTAYKHSMRMGIFIEMALQSSRRLGELLNSRIEDIQWEKNALSFDLSKTEEKKECYVSFPIRFMEKLRLFLSERYSGFIFSTSSGKQVQKDYIWKQINSICKKAQILQKVTPHTLRSTSITLYRTYGFSCDELMDLTGHSCSSMVRYYDKKDNKRNPSNKIYII